LELSQDMLQEFGKDVSARSRALVQSLSVVGVK
jgi:hypothetical protein